MRKAVSAVIVVISLCGFGPAAESQDQKTVIEYRYPVPLGADGFLLMQENRPFFLLACADNQQFQKLRITRARLGGEVMADGSPMRHYPAELSFRVTASALDPTMLNSDIQPVDSKGTDMNSYLLGLRFRLKVYRALRMSVIRPARVVQIGMPSDTPYDERIYRVAFDTDDIPVDARLVLEVISPSGERLSRFHLELL